MCLLRALALSLIVATLIVLLAEMLKNLGISSVYDEDSASEKPAYSAGNPDDFTIISNDEDLPF